MVEVLKEHISAQFIFIFKDSYSNLSRGYAVAWAPTIEDASRLVEQKPVLKVNDVLITIGYANPYCVRYVQPLDRCIKLIIPDYPTYE